MERIRVRRSAGPYFFEAIEPESGLYRRRMDAAGGKLSSPCCPVGCLCCLLAVFVEKIQRDGFVFLTVRVRFAGFARLCRVGDLPDRFAREADESGFIGRRKMDGKFVKFLCRT